MRVGAKERANVITELRIRIAELEDLVERAQADHLRQTKFHTRVCGDADCYRRALEDVREWVNSRIEPRLYVTLQNILSKALGD